MCGTFYQSKNIYLIYNNESKWLFELLSQNSSLQMLLSCPWIDKKWSYEGVEKIAIKKEINFEYFPQRKEGKGAY